MNKFSPKLPGATAAGLPHFLTHPGTAGGSRRLASAGIPLNLH
jgi:hypothetical protein